MISSISAFNLLQSSNTVPAYSFLSMAINVLTCSITGKNPQVEQLFENSRAIEKNNFWTPYNKSDLFAHHYLRKNESFYTQKKDLSILASQIELSPHSFATYEKFKIINSGGLPAVSTFSDDRFVIIWGAAVSISVQPIYGQFFTATGVPDGTVFNVANGIFPAVAAFANDGFVATWNSGSNLYGQLFTNTGAQRNSVFQISNDNYFNSAVATFSDGGFIVVWNNNRNVGVFGQLYASSGAKNGAVFQISDGADPAVASFTDGRFLVTWLEWSSFSTKGKFFTANGVSNGEIFNIASGSYLSAVAAFSTGEFVASFYTPSQKKLSWQYFTAAKIPKGQAFNVISTNDTYSAIAGFSYGGFVTVWDKYSEICAGPCSIDAQYFHDPAKTPTQIPTLAPTLAPTVPTLAPTPTSSPTFAPTLFSQSQVFPIIIIVISAVLLLMVVLCALFWRWKNRKTKIYADFNHAFKMIADNKANEDQVFLQFSEIKKDLLEQAKVILLARNVLMGKTTFERAMHQEFFLLSRYFLMNPSLQAFQAYKKFIQDHQDLYAQRQENWGKYSSLILEETNFSFNDTLENLENENQAFIAQQNAWCYKNDKVFHFNTSSGLMLLLSLPHFSSTELEKINQKIDGFTSLHRIVNASESPIAVLCVLALLDCGANPNIPAQGSLNGKDLDNQSAIHCAKRAYKVQFFNALTNGASMENVYLPQNASERKYAQEEARRAEEKRIVEQQREREKRIAEQKFVAEKAKTDRLLKQCLQYILNNEMIEKVVTEDNKEHFLQTAIALLETSSHFATFKDNVLNRQDYDLGLYTHFKQETNRSIRDLKLRFSFTQCQFEQSELVIMFSNVVLTYQRELDQHECIMRTQTAAQQAHQATINTQAKVAEAANERNNMLFHEQEERRQRAERAADEARTRAQFQQGMKIAQFAINNMDF